VVFHAYLNVCQKKEQKHFVSVSTSVSASVCVGMVTAGKTVGYSIADKGGLSSLICVRVLGGLCVCASGLSPTEQKKNKQEMYFRILKLHNYVQM